VLVIKNLPLISIITIGKENCNSLLKTMNSVKQQSYKSIEHIIVYCGKKNDVEKALVNLRYNDLKYKVIFDEGYGISSAFNIGVLNSSGEYIIFLNSGDIFYEKDSLVKLVNRLDENIDIVTGYSVKEFWGGTLPRKKLNLKKYSQRIYISHQASLFKRDLFYKYGLFNNNFKVRMDLEWLSRLDNKVNMKFVNAKIILFESGGISEKYVNRSTYEEILVLSKNIPKTIKRIIIVTLFLSWYRNVRNIYRYLIRKFRGK